MKKVILIFITCIITSCNNDRTEEKKVKVAPVMRKFIENSSSYSGRIFPRDRVQLISFSSGIVDEVFFKEGDEVKKDDILFTYNQNVIIENEIKLTEGRLELEILEGELRNYDVQKRESGLKSRELEKKSLEYELKKTKDQLPIVSEAIKSAKKIVRMYEEFLREESVSIFELEQKRIDLVTKEAQYEDLKMKLELDEQKYKLLLLTRADMENDFSYNEEKLKSKYEALKKNVENLERALLESRYGFKSTESGILTKFTVQKQEKLERLQNIGILASGENLVVNIKVPVYQASRVKSGQKSIIKFSDSNGLTKYEGEVLRVSNFATESSNRLGVDVEIAVLDKGMTQLKPGYRVDVDIMNSEEKDYLLVKKFSVIEENSKNYIYIVENSRAVKKELQIGIESDSDYEVLNILEGTKIILNPFVVKDGDLIRETLNDR